MNMLQARERLLQPASSLRFVVDGMFLAIEDGRATSEQLLPEIIRLNAAIERRIGADSLQIINLCGVKGDDRYRLSSR